MQPADSSLPRLLVVDDDISHLMIFERAFKHDFTLRVAWSGLEALDILKEEGVDVIVTDYTMPGLNGLALLRETRRRWPWIGRILMTGRPDIQFIEDARSEGVVEALVAKPWDGLEIRDHALALYRRKRAA